MKQAMVIPAFNEESVLQELFARLQAATEPIGKRFTFEYLFINDGSHDSTLEIIKKLRGKNPSTSFVSLSRNFGKEAAMLAAFDHVNSDTTTTIDADLQDPPELIPQMLDYWQQGYDYVCARRKERRGKGWIKKITARRKRLTLNRQDTKEKPSTWDGISLAPHTGHAPSNRGKTRQMRHCRLL